MMGEEESLLARRQQAADTRGAWVQRLVLSAAAITIVALLWAARPAETRPTHAPTAPRPSSVRWQNGFGPHWTA